VSAITIHPEPAMRLAPLVLLPLTALAACATPLEQCLSNATGDLRALDRRIDVTERNIARGYRIVEVSDIERTRTQCVEFDDDGEPYTRSCTETTRIRREEPVAIDATEERRRLSELRAQVSQAQARADAGVQACRATYPAG